MTPPKRSRGLSPAVLLAIMCTGCLSVIPSEPDSNILDEERVCTGTAPEGAASECIGIQAGGCSCNASGTMTAVNAAFVDVIDERRLAAGAATCDENISQSETCCANGAACIDGRCELVGPRGRSLESDCSNPIDAAPQ